MKSSRGSDSGVDCGCALGANRGPGEGSGSASTRDGKGPEVDRVFTSGRDTRGPGEIFRVSEWTPKMLEKDPDEDASFGLIMAGRFGEEGGNDGGVGEVE